jgi:hypothetical protein
MLANQRVAKDKVHDGIVEMTIDYLEGLRAALGLVPRQ